MTRLERPSVQLMRACLAAGAFFLGTDVARAAPPADLPSQPIIGTARVIDGDTIDLAGVRIRLEGIDAPETSQTCGTPDGGTWTCGRSAISELRDLIGDQPLSCQPRGVDKYRRVLGICWAGDINVNEQMIKRGMAWAFVKYSREFVDQEAAARASKVGVWQGPAEAPWDTRKKAWQVAETRAPEGCAIKGNVSSNGKIYHVPWGAWYDKVRVEEGRGERWFCSEDEALKAGWRPASGP